MSSDLWVILRVARVIEAAMLQSEEESGSMNTQAERNESDARNRNASQDADETGAPTYRIPRTGGALPAGEAVPRPEEGRRVPNPIANSYEDVVESWMLTLTEEEQNEVREMVGMYGFPMFMFGGMILPDSYKPTPYVDMPQELADELALVADEASEWFHDHGKMLMLDEPEIAPITDEQVRERVKGFQYSMDREIARLVPFHYNNSWNWRFDDDWAERHAEWIEEFNTELLKPAFAKQVREKKVWRYDLSVMPWQLQYNLCVRWAQIWHAWKMGTGGKLGKSQFDPVVAAQARALAKEQVEREKAEAQNTQEAQS